MERYLELMKDEWENFKGVILRMEELCVLRTLGAGGRKCEWWSSEGAFTFWLQKKEPRTEYKRKGRDARRIIA